MEGRHGRCAACLGPEHAKEALTNLNFCEFCASFSKCTLEKQVFRSFRERSSSIPPGQGSPPPSAQKERDRSCSDGSVTRESRRASHRRQSLRSSSSSSPSPPSASPPKKKRRKSHQSHRSESSEQLDKLWAADSQQGNMLGELLSGHTAPHTPTVPLEQQGAADAEWQQEDLLSIATSEQFFSEEGVSDSATPVAHFFLSAETSRWSRGPLMSYWFHGLFSLWGRFILGSPGYSCEDAVQFA
ncbi:UNVERIFIED_CONTAM: hypothetical protein FKN15_067092 [Acipenser sinensis]